MEMVGEEREVIWVETMEATSEVGGMGVMRGASVEEGEMGEAIVAVEEARNAREAVRRFDQGVTRCD